MIGPARVAAFLLLLAAPAAAQEHGSGCDAFAWNVESERMLLLGDANAANAVFERSTTKAIAVDLVPFAEADLAMPPERAPKDAESFAGSVRFGAGAAQTYSVSLSAAAWIDVIQDGSYVKSGNFTGATDCPGIRKSVEFAIGPSPFIVQLSGADVREIRMVLTPSD